MEKEDVESIIWFLEKMDKIYLEESRRFFICFEEISDKIIPAKKRYRMRKIFKEANARCEKLNELIDKLKQEMSQSR